MRSGWIFFRMVRWPAALMLGNAVVLWNVERFGNAFGPQAQGQVATAEHYVCLGTWAVGLVWLAANAWRARQWELGKGLSCDLCGGPLGWRLDGKVYRGRQLSDYALCWNCGRNRPME
jgi:hypothetical protein